MGSATSIRFTLPTTNKKDKKPRSVIAPIKYSAGLKSPSFTKIPITTGTITADSPPIKLNTPPTNPIKCLGAINETNTHVIDAKPLPKKASVINKMT